MIYAFTPSGKFSPVAHLSQHHSNLDPAQIEQIRDYGDRLETTAVKLYGGYTEQRVKASGARLELNQETEWLYGHMSHLVQQINANDFQYELSGFAESFCYLTYQGPGEHFGWHFDSDPRTIAPRKLSLVLQLSDPSEYEGGDLEIMVPGQTTRANKKQGLVAAFASHKIHRVTPVLSGTRRTLIMFACGPNFR